jgi:hypothetical protein
VAVSFTMAVKVYADATFTSPLDVTADLHSANGLRLKYGIDGNGPLARVASTGECQFGLRNHEGNSVSLVGAYSPHHANVRSGWGFGKYVRVFCTYSAVEYTKFTGKIRVIAPDAGRYGPRRVHVTAYDTMRDLAEADAREVTIQVDKTETQLLDAILAALPAASQPVATNFDTGVDTYPYAFDNVSGGAKALAVMRDVVVSSFGLLVPDGEGTLRYITRHTFAALTSSGTFTDSMVELSVPSSLDGVFDEARSTTHPKQVSAAATDELYTLPPGTSVEVPANAVGFEIWTDYTDPNDRQTNIGGTSVVTTLVAGTHYAGNSQADGLGTNQNAALTVSIDPFGTTAKWTVDNSSSAPVFLTTQKVIGKAVRDPGPQTFQSPVGTAGERPITIDLPYQDDPYIGQSVADYVVSLYSNPAHQVESITFIANASNTLMLQAMQREPGDLITISETVTGLASALAIIQSVSFEVVQGLYLLCRWGLAPADSTRYWQLGVAGASELGETTILGF